MGSASQIALLVAFMVSVASADYYSDGCKEVVCKEVGAELRHPNPRDECSFCCCFHERDLNRHAEYRACPGNGRYDRTLNKCVLSNFCPHPKETPTPAPRDDCSDAKCEECFEGMDIHVRNPHDPCSYCNCTESGPVKVYCPDGEKFDPVTQFCYPSSECASPSTPPPVCNGVTCPTSYMPGNFLTANPDDPCSYCQCIWGLPVIQQCARNTGWSEMYSQCMPVPGC